MNVVSDIAPVTDPADHPVPAPRRGAGIVDALVRWAGFVVALLLAAGSALFEALLTPLYLGDTRFPLAVLLAVVGNLGLVWFTVTVTGRRLAAAGPALVWTVVMVTASTRTTEGDLVLTSNNWIGIGTMLAGSLAFTAAGLRLVRAGLRLPPTPRPPAQRGPAPPE